MAETETKEMALHWLMVGYVSPRAKEWIEEVGGQVKQVNDSPRLFAVALAYAVEGAWTWSKGRQQHRQGIEYWNTGELQEASTSITLSYGCIGDKYSLGEYSSADDTYLILPDEEFDETTNAVKEQPAPEEIAEIPTTLTEDSIWASLDSDPDLDAHPF